MQRPPGHPRRRARLARALGLDRNPLRRVSDRAEAWIRIGLLAVFLIAGPVAAISAGGWAYHAGIATAPVHGVPAHRVSATALRPALAPSYPDQADPSSPAWAATRWQSTDAAAARSSEMLAAVMTLALIALALLATQRLTLALLTRRRLAAWGTAWSRVGPQWSRGRP